MFKKIVIIAVVLFTLLMSSPTNAIPVDNTSVLPENNPFCWHRSDCWNIRRPIITGQATDKELDKGFVTGGSVAPCVGGGDPGSANEWGRCLPAGKTKTEISFGGKDEFNNIGDFLVVMYKYLLTIASIVAVVMIIIAGAQWITSGGNSEAISSAKKRIGGAVIGLFIAYMSYFVLNTINPALVNLRLPQVWLVKPLALMPEFCSDLETPNKKLNFMLAADGPDWERPVTLETAADKKYGFKRTNPSTFPCGARFFAEAGGSAPCTGALCTSTGEGENKKNEICFDVIGNRKRYGCEVADLIIRYAVDVSIFDVEEQAGQQAEKVAVLDWFVTKAMVNDWLNQNPVFRGVCKKDNKLYLAKPESGLSWNDGGNDLQKTPRITKTAGSPYSNYTFLLSELIGKENNWDCQGGVLMGYFIRHEVIKKGGVGARFADTITAGLYNSHEYPNLIIGFDQKSHKALHGSFSDDIKSLANYIPIDELKKPGGLILDVRFTMGELDRIVHKYGEAPNSAQFPENILNADGTGGIPAQ